MASDGSSSGGPASYPGDGEAGDAGTGGGDVGSAASLPEKTDDDDTSGGSGSQPGGTDNTGSGSGGDSARQPDGTGDAGPSGGNGGSQPREGDDGAQYNNGRPRVELFSLAVRSHLCVVGMTIVVFDGKRGQIIYKEEQGQHNKEEQGDQQVCST